MTKTTVYNTVSAITAALQERTRAEAVLSKVNKGRKGTFSYVPWNESAQMLTDIFGVFGWNTQKIGSVEDIERGIYIYDIELHVIGVDEAGMVYHKSVTGRGMGEVSVDSLANGEAHDTAGKGARSDALSVAVKQLGDAFGLFLYDRGDPARGGVSPQMSGAASVGREQGQYVAPSGYAQPASGAAGDLDLSDLLTREVNPPKKDGYFGNVSPAQANKARAAGWSDAELLRLSGTETRAVMDGIFGKDNAPKITPPGASATTKVGNPALSVVGDMSTEPDDIPFR